MKEKGATTQIKIYFTSSGKMYKEVSMVEPCFPVLINPKMSKAIFQVRVGHYSFSFDATVLKLLVVIGHFIMYMGIYFDSYC